MAEGQRSTAQGVLHQDSTMGVYTRTPLQIQGYSFLKGTHLMKIDKYLQRTIIQKIMIIMKSINPAVEAPLHTDSNPDKWKTK